MKIEQIKTPDDFKKITKTELYKLWFGTELAKKPYTDKQIAKMYGVTKKEVKEKRKQFNLSWFQCAILFITGNNRYKEK